MAMLQMWRVENVMFLLRLLVIVTKPGKISMAFSVNTFHPKKAQTRTFPPTKHVASLTHTISTKAEQRKVTDFSSPASLSSEDAFELERFQRIRKRKNNVITNDSGYNYEGTTSLPPQEVVTSVLVALQSAPYYYDFDPYKPKKQHPGIAMLRYC
jgi:hypothetical protein